MIKEFKMPKVPSPSKLLTSFELFEKLKASNFDLRTVHGVAFPGKSRISYHIKICQDDMPNLEHKPCNGYEFLYGPDKPSLTQSLWLRYQLKNCDFSQSERVYIIF
jgi:hypothetical protein